MFKNKQSEKHAARDRLSLK